MQEFDNAERELLALARRGLTPTADDSARVLAGVERRLATSAVAGEGEGGAEGKLADVRAGSVLRVGAMHWARRSLLTLVIAGASGFTGYRLGLQEGQRQLPARAIASPDSPARAAATESDQRPAPRAVPPAPVPAREALAPAVAKSASAGARRPPPTPRATSTADPAASASSLQREIAALREAERALRGAQPGLALEMLDALDRELPDGRLLEERSAAASVARCALGLGSRNALREAFVRVYPDSMYRERVEQGCAAR